MKLTIFHAEHRCAPCRDMHNRVDVALANYSKTSGRDASGFIEYIDIDANPELAPHDLVFVPTIVVDAADGRHFRSDGRCSIEQVEFLLDLIGKRNELPEAQAAAIFDEFSPDAPSANPVFYRTYSRRKEDGSRETYQDTVERAIDDIVELGLLGEEQNALVRSQAEQQHALPSGRWLWVGGTKWISKRENFSGAYNCTSTTVDSPEAFGLMMELAMMGSGTGAILEREVVAKLPPIARQIKIAAVTPVGRSKRGGRDNTSISGTAPDLVMEVGDSRQGWVDAYQGVIDLAMTEGPDINLTVDLSQIRPAGSPLKGFGGKANPVKLPVMFEKMAQLLSKAAGRQLTPIEACLLIDEAAACIVAGNIRRSAGMRQFSADDQEAATAKLGLYSQDEEGNWRVDPARENLRMANHTRCYHRAPSMEEVIDAVTNQFHSGEGAIQYVPEAVARSNADLLADPEMKALFIDEYQQGRGRDFLCAVMDALNPDMPKAEKERELDHRMMRYGLNPCGEILGADFHCNLAEVHLNTIDPMDLDAQEDAFQAAALEVAALLFHEFRHERYQYSRSLDPIVGVSFTGLFDFFVKAFGAEWLQWLMAGRPEQGSFADQEAQYLNFWRTVVESTVEDFCEARGLKAPNRTTTVQPAGTKSLLTGASSGWHPPKAARFIRRITFGANDPVALAAIEAGYSVVPSPSARDDEGNLLDNINDPRVTEWLVEIPTAVSWADLPGCDAVDLSKLPAAAQFGLYMNVQKHYTTHNTSATIELREDEIESLAQCIYNAIEAGDGYISAALLARFDVDGGTFPRLPFEPISRDEYERLSAEVASRKRLSFRQALEAHDRADLDLMPAESACTSAACVAAADKAEREGKA